MTPEILYTCPYCQRNGFTHRGLVGHVCASAPGITQAIPKRFLTLPEIAKIVVSTPVPPTP